MKPGDRVVCIDETPTFGSKPGRWEIIGRLPRAFQIFTVQCVHEYEIGDSRFVTLEFYGSTTFNMWHPEIKGFNAQRFAVVDW